MWHCCRCAQCQKPYEPFVFTYSMSKNMLTLPKINIKTITFAVVELPGTANRANYLPPRHTYGYNCNCKSIYIITKLILKSYILGTSQRLEKLETPNFVLRLAFCISPPCLSFGYAYLMKFGAYDPILEHIFRP